MKSSKVCKRSALSLAVLAALLPSHLIAEEMPADDDTIEEITVVGRSVSYANNATDDTDPVWSPDGVRDRSPACGCATPME